MRITPRVDPIVTLDVGREASRTSSVALLPSRAAAQAAHRSSEFAFGMASQQIAELERINSNIREEQQRAHDTIVSGEAESDFLSIQAGVLDDLTMTPITPHQTPGLMLKNNLKLVLWN